MKKAAPDKRSLAPSDPDRDRLERGRRRLEDLLRDPGPGITVVRRHEPDASPLPQQQSSANPSSGRPDATAADAGAPAKSATDRRPGPAPSPEPAEAAAPRSPARRAARNAEAARPKKPAARERNETGPVRRRPDGAVRFKEAGPRWPAETPPPAAEPSPARPAPAVGHVAAAPAASAAGSAPAPEGPPRRESESEIERALMASRRAFVSLGIFSFVINLLMLAGPLFMLQVYDRVISSGSIPTLVALTAMTAGVYAIIGTLEVVRSRVVVRVGYDMDSRLGQRIFDAALRLGATSGLKGTNALRELDSLRQFVGSPGPLAFLDAPWTPIYLLVIFMIHWTLGLAATLGAIALVTITWLSETHARNPLQEAGKTAARSIDIAEAGQRNAEAIAAMGMGPDYRRLWTKTNRDALSWSLLASDRLGTMSALSRTLRLLMQSLMLAVGAWLAVEGEITAGAIVAATIIFGRALSPVEQAIAHWRPFLKAKDAYHKLNELLRGLPAEAKRTALPRPRGHLEVSNLRVASPATRQLILSGISFRVEPGHVLAVIGPSASGKSTLVRTLVGLWRPLSGTLTLDGARLDQWHPDDLGRHIGYLPQSVELFSGTVRQNIARFADGATDDEVIAAARAAFAHELILALPDGYDTELGSFGTYLSGGQRQRIALARALFRFPPLVILDEPNANLDRNGDVALSASIDAMRERGQTVILVSHRVQAVGKADFLLLLEKGQQRAFGPREAVLRMVQTEAAEAAAQRAQADQRAAGEAAPATAEPAASTADPVPPARAEGEKTA